MQELQKVKIELLIRQLELEIQQVTASHDSEIKRNREVIAFELQEQFERRLHKVDAMHQARILDLEEEIRFLKELNSSQRKMMEDNLGYMRGLEEKLKTPPIG